MHLFTSHYHATYDYNPLKVRLKKVGVNLYGDLKKKMKNHIVLVLLIGSYVIINKKVFYANSTPSHKNERSLKLTLRNIRS